MTPLKLRVRGTAPHPTPTGLRGALRGLGAAVRALLLVWTLRTQQRAPGGHSAALGGQGGELEPG